MGGDLYESYKCALSFLGLCSRVCNTHFSIIGSIKNLDKTPYELWYEKSSNWPLLKVWGCEALHEERYKTNLVVARSIMYAVTMHRPDVAFAQNLTSRFQTESVGLERAPSNSTLQCLLQESEYIALSELPLKVFGSEVYLRDLGAPALSWRYHLLRYVELANKGILKVQHVNNLVDPFTKALSNRMLAQHCRGMGASFL
ncbi:hypothetical protein Tco_1493345 [Tanacetum coccineum]